MSRPPGAAPIQVLALLTDAYGPGGGIGQFNHDLLAALLAMPDIGAVQVLARHTDPAATPPHPGLRVSRLARHGRTAFALRSAAAALSARPVDLVVCGHLNLLPFAAAVAALRRRPLLAVLHGIEAWPEGGRLRSALVGRVDRYLAVSRCTAYRFRAWAGVAGDRIGIFPNTVDTGRFVPGPPRADLQARYGIDGRTVLMGMGRLVGRDRDKGFDEIIEVMPRLLQAVPDLVYLVCGDGPDRGRLEAKATAAGVGDRVRFTGFVGEADKVAHFQLADAFVLAGGGEGFGIVLLEAMACGVPVVASVRDGSADAVADGRLGELVDPRVPDDLVRGILAALARPRGRPPAGLDRFAPPAFAGRLADALAATLGRPVAPPPQRKR